MRGSTRVLQSEKWKLQQRLRPASSNEALCPPVNCLRRQNAAGLRAPYCTKFPSFNGDVQRKIGAAAKILRRRQPRELLKFMNQVGLVVISAIKSEVRPVRRRLGAICGGKSSLKAENP